MIWIYHTYFEPDSSVSKRATEHEQGIKLLCRALEERYGISREKGGELEILKGAHGKPYLKDYPRIHYNISHCRGLAAVAVGDSPVGIDVERVRPYRETLPEKVLSKAELRQMEAAGKDGKTELFFRFWTLKESYVKAEGCGITVPLKEISFQIGKNGAVSCDRPGWKFWQRDMAEGCILSACVAGGEEIRLAEQEEQA